MTVCSTCEHIAGSPIKVLSHRLKDALKAAGLPKYVLPGIPSKAGQRCRECEKGFYVCDRGES